MSWKIPKNDRGRPCGHCTRMGKPCRSHGGNGNAGAHSKLNPDLIKKAVELLEDGNYQETTAHALGISPSTWHRWIQDGQALTEAGKTGLHRDFSEACAGARARAESEAVARLLAAGKPRVRQVLSKDGEVVDLTEPGDWRADAHFLERAFPDKWGRRDRVAMDHQGSVDVNLGFDASKFPPAKKRDEEDVE